MSKTRPKPSIINSTTHAEWTPNKLKTTLETLGGRQNEMVSFNIENTAKVVRKIGTLPPPPKKIFERACKESSICP